jgi:5-methylthioribose kinase
MNCAACGDGYCSFIVKQSRGYEKYPVLLLLRVLTEGALSKNCGGRYCTANHAEALGIDAINNMIALEDLGKANDFTILYDEKENYKNRNSTN